jgi:hypothetical protein
LQERVPPLAVARHKLSPNAQRRALARAAEKLGRERERLARLEPGGAADRPIDVVSASIVESMARAGACPRCEGPVNVDEHAARTVEGRRLRIARVRCPRCGAGREIYFRIVGGEAN